MSTANYTVLSGDIVGSSEQAGAQYDGLLYTLEQGLRALCERFDGHFNIYRGDAFQCILGKAPIPLQATLMLRLYLRSHALDARVSEAIGPIDNYRQDVKTATGAALMLSGKGLDTIKNKRLSLSLYQSPLSASFALNIRFLDHLINHTSQKQPRPCTGITGWKTRIMPLLLLSWAAHEPMSPNYSMPGNIICSMNF
ncbi:hypothetical protein [Pseudoalteromonas sp. T1lg22]|uniref:hypothetical protein n=1 Tax=Pseudoalteromonas sp. T1lg22 TaxID=2077096 RepID=UPI000CF6D4A7|nr:hypothetical protein [Pseudoalteromonas sp. T1lg22]